MILAHYKNIFLSDSTFWWKMLTIDEAYRRAEINLIYVGY